VSPAAPAHANGAAVLSALIDQPGGTALLALAQRREDLMLVGGAVRDLLLGLTPLELDVTVVEGAAQAAASLAAELSLPETVDRPRIVAFERFGTACVEWDAGRIDIAQRRAESYPWPGSLPEVEPGDLPADLARRDFTLNAIALPLSGPDAGVLQAVESGLEDLQARRLRVLHDRSFLDDPTRLLRLARYSGRLGFEVEPRTAELARSALTDGALDTVSEARIGAELWLAVSEEDPIKPLVALDELGVLTELGLLTPFERPPAEAALALLPADGSPAELLMAILLHRPDTGEADRLRVGDTLNGFEVPADARERILTSVFTAGPMAQRLRSGLRPSDLRLIFARAPVEAIALAGALAQRRSSELGGMAEHWLAELRHVRLRIGGEDLLAAGISQGPEVGLRLVRALDMKLDGEIPDSAEAELQAALGSPS
jgi:tRNA nucleotidyltransferase (CCA-adding enzyme)